MEESKTKQPINWTIVIAVGILAVCAMGYKYLEIVKIGKTRDVVFEQKKQCEPYRVALQEKYDKEDREDEAAFSNSGVRVCYSTRYNSCVGYAVRMRSFLDSDDGKTSYSLIDLLKGNELGAYTELLKQDYNEYFYKRHDAFQAKMDEVNCSDGKRLDTN